MGQVIPFEAGQVPDHIRQAFGNNTNSDLAGGVSLGFPILSFKGKVWHMVQGDNRTLITDDEGEPRSSLELILLKANPHVSKVYYPNGYTEGSDEKPACFSNDGVAPDAGAPDKQANKCAICPHNQWGSRITENGAKGKACADSRRLAVAPAGDPTNAMLLRVPAGSLKELVSYADILNRRSTLYQSVVTKLSFDHTVAHQKLLFKPMRYLEPDEVDAVLETLNGSLVDTILGITPAAAEADEDDFLGAPPAHVAKLNAPAEGAKPRRAKAAVSVDEVEAIIEKAPAPEPAPAAEPKATVKGFGSAAPKAAAAAAPKPAPVAAAAPAKVSKVIDDVEASLDDILASLDD